MSRVSVLKVIPVPSDGIKVVSVIMKLMYYQGMWYEDPEPDLDFYLQFFTPRMAQVIVKYKYCRLALHFLRNVYPCTMIVSTSCQVVFLFPMGIYLNLNNKTVVLIHCYLIMVYALACAGMLTFFCQKKSFKHFFEELQEMSRSKQLDNKEQNNILNKTALLCFRITKYIHIIIVPIFALGMINLTIFYFLPKRIVFVNEWYPWDTSASPAFEVTLFYRLWQTIALFLTANTMISAITVIFMLTLTRYLILQDKIKNVQTLAIKRIRESKLKESMALAGLPQGILKDNGMYFGASVPSYVAKREVPYAGRAYLYARRLNKLKILSQPENTEEYSGHVAPVLFSIMKKDKNATKISYKNNRHAEHSRVIQHPAFGHVAKRVKQRTRATVGELNGITPKELDREMQYLLKKYIRLHTRILSFTRELGSTINIYLITIFLVNITTLGTTVLITTAKEFGNYESIILIISLEIIGLYLMHNYLATLIATQSEAVGDAVYNTDWTGASPSFKKSLLIIMSRATVPLQIKPTGLDSLSLKNFAEVTINAYKMMSTINRFMK